jgi:hypothetical protein
MCDECEEFPAQYVAYFNKAGGKLWRPAQKASTMWAIDIRAVEPSSRQAGEGRAGVRPFGSAGVPPALENYAASAAPGPSERAGETPALPASRFRCEETRS